VPEEREQQVRAVPKIVISDPVRLGRRNEKTMASNVRESEGKMLTAQVSRWRGEKGKSDKTLLRKRSERVSVAGKLESSGMNSLIGT
jgi:hypothetical protein